MRQGAENTSPEEAVADFHRVVEDLARQLETGSEIHGITQETILQGRFSDAATRAWQWAMLRRRSGSAGKFYLCRHLAG